MSRTRFFSGFDRIDSVYKTVDGVPFEVSTLIPKGPSSSPRPVLAHFHSGGFVLGTALDPQTFPRLLEFAETKGAVVVSPCHRLLPEASGCDILDDVRDFWAWLNTSLARVVSATRDDVSVDLDRIAVAGQDSGGVLALLSVTDMSQVRLKMAIGQYCAMDAESAVFNQKPPLLLPDQESHLSDYLARIRPGTFRLSSPYPEYAELLSAALETGRWRELLGDDTSLRLRRFLDAEKLPPVWIVQGADDRMVSKAAADELVGKIRERHPETPLLYTVATGGYGFDIQQGIGEKWVQEGVAFVNQYW
ncbi:Alpha/Beta hydrolase protein [Podospora aff. communis PSN243]|uniref:Alpha/Beta hydrolase protein n=1 Tax=Podospora aff. communis PSN243 TaxID=3040156 RepID=A0AAV9G3G3_9PEZI|nr:Alpha/Beta hydrolase protein [Podospora aff. communis PSN243]